MGLNGSRIYRVRLDRARERRPAFPACPPTRLLAHECPGRRFTVWFVPAPPLRCFRWVQGEEKDGGSTVWSVDARSRKLLPAPAMILIRIIEGSEGEYIESPCSGASSVCTSSRTCPSRVYLMRTGHTPFCHSSYLLLHRLPRGTRQRACLKSFFRLALDEKRCRVMIRIFDGRQVGLVWPTLSRTKTR